MSSYELKKVQCTHLFANLWKSQWINMRWFSFERIWFKYPTALANSRRSIISRGLFSKVCNRKIIVPINLLTTIKDRMAPSFAILSFPVAITYDYLLADLVPELCWFEWLELMMLLQKVIGLKPVGHSYWFCHGTNKSP